MPYGDHRRPLIVSLPFAVLLVLIVGCDSASSREALLHWEIRAALGLPGGLVPEQLASGRPAIRSPEEVAILEDAEHRSCVEYERIKALVQFSTHGNGANETISVAGYALSWAQARLGWAKGDANETIVRLEQATRFADNWLEVYRADWGEDLRTPDRLSQIVEAQSRSNTALIRIRNALKQLGIDTNRLPRQINPWKPIPDECVRE